MPNKRRSYEDFEPFCKWRKEEKHDILEVHLQGFKKQQLRVQLINGLIVISGEQLLDETRLSRFRKEINVSKDLKPKHVHAKFSGGILYITIRKEIYSFTTPSQPTLTSKSQGNEQSNQQINQEKEIKGFGVKDSGTRDHIAANGINASSLSTIAKSTDCNCAAGMTSSGLKMSGKTAMKLGALAAVVMVVSIGAYVAYKYRQAFHVED